ncbi:MAG TPA: cytochrome P450 [Vicinamibacteria bacterium]|nr:cytochrome P450 [Vicinamibacteria bacterium]
MSAAPVPFGPKGPPVLGQLLAFRRDPLEFLTRIAREYPGDIVRFRPGPRDSYLVKDPDLVKEILVTRQHDFSKSRGLDWAKLFLGEGLLTSEGEFHTRQRRLAQPAFHRQRIGAYAEDMVRRTVDARDRWSAGQVLDVDGEMMRLTLAVVSSTLFGTDVAASADEVREDLAAIIGLFPRFSLPLFGLIQKLPIPSNVRFNRAVARLDALVYGIIAQRQRDPGDRGDLLSMLLLARDEEGGGGMSERQLRDEVITLLLAGHETTANALTWTWYLLSQNEEADARWREELRRVLGDRAPTAEDIPALRYTEMVLAESMRLFPPAWGMGRRALRDLTLGGFTIRRGSVLALSPYIVHRDPRLWPDPLRFDPERFTAEAKAERPRFAYFPFGAGARSCIGEPFAWMEGVLLLATIGQRWRLRLLPGHPVEPKALMTLRPRYGMKMVAEPAS